MTQLIAAFNYDQKKLGPANARGNLNDLFEEDSYSLIRKNPPIRAYQLFLLALLNDWALSRLAHAKTYIRNLKGYVDLSAFALLCKTIRECGLAFGKENVNQILEREYSAYQDGWQLVVKGIVDVIHDQSRKTAKVAWKRERSALTPANYFKNGSFVAKLMERPIPSNVRKIARDLVQ
jgi:hypothetical protein